MNNKLLKVIVKKERRKEKKKRMDRRENERVNEKFVSAAGICKNTLHELFTIKEIFGFRSPTSTKGRLVLFMRSNVRLQRTRLGLASGQNKLKSQRYSMKLERSPQSKTDAKLFGT